MASGKGLRFGLLCRLLVPAAVVLALAAAAPPAGGSGPAIGTITEFPITGGGALGITTGQDGNLWFTGGSGIGRITPTGTVTEFPYSDSDWDPGSSLTMDSIAAGPDGNLWFIAGCDNTLEDSGVIGTISTCKGRIGRITPAGAITTFAIPSNGPLESAWPHSIIAGPGGTLWFLMETDTFDWFNSCTGCQGWGAHEVSYVVQVTTGGGFTRIALPNEISPEGVPFTSFFATEGLAAGADGDLYVTELFGRPSEGVDRILRVSPSGGVTAFVPPEHEDRQDADTGPYAIAAGPDGQVWFTEAGGIGSRVDRIAPDGSITGVGGVSQGSYGIAPGPAADGAMWVTDFYYGKIDRLTATGQQTQYTVPTTGSEPHGITAGPDGNIWFTEEGANKIGRLQLVPSAPDTTPPAITLTTPADGATYQQGGHASASYSCTDDDSGVASCAGSVQTGWPIDTTTVGDHTFTVTATDNAGNTATVTHHYTVEPDTTPPTINILIPGDGVLYPLNAGFLFVTYSCNDTGSGVATCVGDDPQMTMLDTSTSGNYTFTVNAVDNAGNHATLTAHYHVGDDTTPPTITVTRPADGAVYWANVPLAAAYTCADAESGIATCAGDAANGGGLDTSHTGSHTFTVTATDKAGNQATVTHGYTVEPDTTPPEITLATPWSNAPFKLDQVVTADYQCTDHESGIASCDGDLPEGARIDTSKAGSYTFTVNATDKAGNQATLEHPYTVEGDTTPPTITFNAPAGYYDRGKVVTVDYSCDDADSGIATCVGDLPNGASLNTSKVGAYTFTVTATDKAGNTATVTHHYNIANVSPTITIDSPAANATYQLGDTVTASYSCNEEDYDIATCTGDVPDGAPVDTSTAGQHSFAVTATDAEGNEATVTHYYDVAVKPTITLTVPGDGASYGQGTKVQAVYSCSEPTGGPGIATCDGDVAAGGLIDTSPGDHSFTVTATDKAGKTATMTAAYTVEADTTPPTITLIAPADGAVYTLHQVVAADYTCADEPGGSGLYGCTADRAVGAAIDTSTPGDHTFSVGADDHAGNHTEVVHTYRVVDDTTPPTIDLITPADGAVYTIGQDVTVSYNCEDEPGGSGLASCTGNLADGAKLPTSKAGSFGFSVTATDNAGNKSSELHEFTVLADTTPPVITLTSPADGGTYTQGEDVTVAFGCEDEAGGSGVASCTGDLADGGRLDTSTPGNHAFTVTSTDNAGNKSEVTHHYRVASDVIPPTITLAAPAVADVYEQGDHETASFSCEDEAGGSGIASCDGSVDNGAAIDTSRLGSFPFVVVATDKAGNEQTVTHRYKVVKHASGTLGAGDTLTTDPTATGPTASDPVQAAVTSPGGGAVSIVVGPATGGSPSGFNAAGMEVDITAPPAIDAAHPLVIVFEVAAAQLPPGATAATLQVFKNGVQVPACAGIPGIATPDPCVSARDALPGGGVRLTVLTTSASAWRFAQPVPASSGGGSGGSAPARASADLAVTVVPSASRAGVGVPFTLTVHTTTSADATGVHVTLELPDGVEVVSLPPGCTGVRAIDCDIGSLAAGTGATTVVTVRASKAGQALATATVAGDQSDPSVSSNTASSTVAVVDLTVGAGSKPVRAVVHGRVATVSLGVVLSIPATVRIVAAGPKGTALTLLPGSHIADTVTGRSRTSIVYAVDDAGACTMSLRIPASQLRRGVRYVVRVVATEAGHTAGATIAFRRP